MTTSSTPASASPNPASVLPGTGRAPATSATAPETHKPSAAGDLAAGDRTYIYADNAATTAMGIPFPLLSLKNQAFFHFGFQAVRMALTRCVLSLRGVWIDCPSLHKDQIYPAPAPAPGQEQLDFVPWPLPKMGWKMRLKLAGDQLRILKL